MLLSAVSVLVVAQSSSEIPEGLMNNPVYKLRKEFSRMIEYCDTTSVYRGDKADSNLRREEKPTRCH